MLSKCDRLFIPCKQIEVANSIKFVEYCILRPGRRRHLFTSIMRKRIPQCISKLKTVITLNLLFIGTWIDKINLIAYSTLYGNYDWYCCRHLDCKRRLPAISHTNLQLLWRNEEKNFLCSYCSRHSFLSFNFLFIVGLLKMEFILIIDLDNDLLNAYYQYNYISSD